MIKINGEIIWRAWRIEPVPPKRRPSPDLIPNPEEVDICLSCQRPRCTNCLERHHAKKDV